MCCCFIVAVNSTSLHVPWEDAPRDRGKKHGASFSPVRVESPDLEVAQDTWENSQDGDDLAMQIHAVIVLEDCCSLYMLLFLLFLQSECFWWLETRMTYELRSLKV